LIILQIYNEQITDLLDPTQGNLQVKSSLHFAVSYLWACLFSYYNLEAYVCRLEKMSKLAYMSIIWQRKVCVPWRMLSNYWIRHVNWN